MKDVDDEISGTPRILRGGPGLRSFKSSLYRQPATAISSV